MKKHIFLFCILSIFSMTLAACNLPSNEVREPVDPMNAVNTAAAQTVVAMTTQLAQGQTPITAPTSEGGAQFPTLAASQTPVSTQAVIPSLTPLATAIVVATSIPATTVPCDRAQFMADVTVPDDAQYNPGSTFTKTWRLKNSGSCTWTTSYRLTFESGDAMGGPASVNLPSNVAPGDVIDLSVNLKAPEVPKTYQGFWKLTNSSGAKFGLGAGDKAFWVKIAVVSPGFAVTSVNGSASPSSYNGSCASPVAITYTFNVTVSAAGKVTYLVKFSDNSTTATKELVFDAAGTKPISETWNVTPPSSPYTASAQLYIDNPNHQWFGPFSATITCVP